MRALGWMCIENHHVHTQRATFGRERLRQGEASHHSRHVKDAVAAFEDFDQRVRLGEVFDLEDGELVGMGGLQLLQAVQLRRIRVVAHRRADRVTLLEQALHQVRGDEACVCARKRWKREWRVGVA